MLQRLYRNVRQVLRDVWGQSVELRFEVCKSPVEVKSAETEDMPLFRLLAQQAETAPDIPLHERISRPKRAPLPESDLNPRFTFERFIVNGSNRITYEAARAIAEYPAGNYNPFVIYGGVGLGKTHLLQAIAHVCQEKGCTPSTSRQVFINDLVSAIRSKTTAMFATNIARWMC
jgi:chromosomal replication initiator protein